MTILQRWVEDLGLRHQGVLLAAIRGCDGRPKESYEKVVVRELRGLVLNAFDPRELKHLRGFMVSYPHPEADQCFKKFLREEVESLPVHYALHLCHAIEVIAYCHPEHNVSTTYTFRYKLFCQKFHMQPESALQMKERLTEDRIAAQTVEA